MNRKILLGLIFMLFCAPMLVIGQDLEQKWNDANTLYINGEYVAAAEKYESILADGQQSAKLYFNLGNAYFKRGMNGRAILNYNKALKLSPSDEDIIYNLAIANAFVQDKIDTIPQFFLKSWVSTLRSSLNSNSWATISIVILVLLITCAIIYLLMRSLVWRKTGFYSMLVLMPCFVVAVIFAAVNRDEIINPVEAIIISGTAPVKSSPEGGKDLFVLHEGTKVKVKSQFGQWREIAIADGNKGWVAASSIEMID